MDCEKFESTLIDELYASSSDKDGDDGLDELTSAASKRHAAGCARCAELLGGLRATRRVAVLPLLEVPAGLEERILQAAQNAQKVVPFRGRLARAVSLAGSWAMRPQTAMAAVFLLMIGSSVLLVRGRRTNAPASASMVVTEQGSPAASAALAENDGLGDMQSAANAHGAIEPKAMATASPAAPFASTTTAAATPAEEERELAFAEKTTRNSEGKKEAVALRADDSPYGGRARVTGGSGAGNAAAPAGAPGATMPMTQAVAAPPSEPVTGAATPSGGATLANGMSAYKAKSYDEATRTFDALASSGDANAALWAARSVRESAGCASAVARFDQVAAGSYGTASGYDATLEGGRCYKSMASFEAARSRFSRLLTVPSHAARAQAELDAMTARAAPKAAPRPSRMETNSY